MHLPDRAAGRLDRRAGHIDRQGVFGALDARASGHRREMTWTPPLCRALAAGASASGQVSRQPFGDIAPMRDPFGHGFCLIAFSEIGYDAGVSG